MCRVNVCFSGAAEGADQFWGVLALQYGHELIHWSFGKHSKKNKFIGSEYIHILSQDELNCADPYLIKANTKIKRCFPTTSQYVNNLLRRNYFQINNSDSVYAVCNFDDKGIYGGTAWAIQMFIDMCYENNTHKPLYILNQIDGLWYTYSYNDDNWYTTDIIPIPSGKWTGIGSRNISDVSRYKMLDLFEK